MRGRISLAQLEAQTLGRHVAQVGKKTRLCSTTGMLAFICAFGTVFVLMATSYTSGRSPGPPVHSVDRGHDHHHAGTDSRPPNRGLQTTKPGDDAPAPSVDIAPAPVAQPEPEAATVAAPLSRVVAAQVEHEGHSHAHHTEKPTDALTPLVVDDQDMPSRLMHASNHSAAHQQHAVVDHSQHSKEEEEEETMHAKFHTSNTSSSEICAREFDFAYLTAWNAKRATFCDPIAGRQLASRLDCRVTHNHHLPPATAPHTLCDARNLVIDFARVSSAPCCKHRPGYFCDGSPTYHHYARGALQGTCTRTVDFQLSKFPVYCLHLSAFISHRDREII